MPEIEIDADVFRWLQSLATPLVDTPNSVLRRLAGFGSEDHPKQANGDHDPVVRPTNELKTIRSTTQIAAEGACFGKPAYRAKRKRSAEARWLVRQWNIRHDGQPVRHALYHRDGSYYNHLKEFPAALLDPDGYVVFPDRESYSNCRNLRHGDQLHAQPSIKEIEGYIEVDPHLRVRLGG